MDVRVVWTLEDWASAIVDLTVSSPLPERVVVVPNERVAHALRRALIAQDARDVLAGALFSTPLALASELLREAGESLRANAHTLGPHLVRDALAESELTHIAAEALLEGPALDAAVARVMGELEAVGLEPRDLRASSDRRARDLGRIMESLRASGALVTESAIFARAARLAPTCARERPTLAVVTGYESAAEAQFLRALPCVTLATWALRPACERHRARLVRLYGDEAARPLTPRRVRGSKRALDILQARLFTPSAPERAPRDCSVELSSYDSAADEVDAALTWVAEQVSERGVAPEEIAVLAPSLEPWGALVRARMAQLPGAGTRPLARSEAGVPLSECSDAAPLLLVLHALRSGLGREAMVTVLPSLRSRLDQRNVRDHVHARSLLGAVAVPGGTRENPRAGRAWPEAWESAILRLEQARGAISERAKARALVEELAGLAPAIDALTDVLRHVLADAPLSIVWMCLSTFARTHLRCASSDSPLWSTLEEALEVFTGHEEREPIGVDALSWLEQTIRITRVATQPVAGSGFYLGTFHGARGLGFRCVRLLGLSEEEMARPTCEDALLPDALRASISSRLLTSRQRVHEQWSDFDAAVRAARERLALSVSRPSPDTAVSPVLFAVLTALGADDGAAACERELLRRKLVTPRPEQLSRSWQRASSSARSGQAPLLLPTPASSGARAGDGRESASMRPSALRSPQFAAAVKLALALLLTKRAGNADGATRRAARVCGLEEGCDVATEDVRRTYDALEASGMLAHPLRVSYPVAGVLSSGALAVGSVDLIVQTPTQLQLLTFVSDPGGRGPAARSHPEVTRRLEECAALLGATGAAGERIVRTGVVFTAAGSVRWLSDEEGEAAARPRSPLRQPARQHARK